MSEDIEDVWAIVHERDSLRRRVKRLEAENRRLRIIVSGYTKNGVMKPEDAKGRTADGSSPEVTSPANRQDRL
jgi:hypothetical protein